VTIWARHASNGTAPVEPLVSLRSLHRATPHVLLPLLRRVSLPPNPPLKRIGRDSPVQEAGVDVVVALTHMRAPNDIRLLEMVPEVDVVLGGHDHQYLVQHVQPHGNLLVKSGTDFKDLTLVEIQRSQGAAESRWGGCVSIAPCHFVMLPACRSWHQSGESSSGSSCCFLLLPSAHHGVNV
jgi:hypothetical protein